MAQKPIRFGIIGCGLMGREFASAAARWCHLLDTEAKPEVVALCDKSPEEFEWFKKHFPDISQTAADYRELLENPDIDAIYCATPHHLHQQMYVDIIEAGKRLLGEKPFGIDKAANEAILAAAAAKPELVVRCSSEFPFYPGAQRIVRLINENAFGTIIEVECGFMHSTDMDPEKPINWKRTVEYNGEYGCMGDLGLHVFHIPLRAGWAPKTVSAVLSNIARQRKDSAGKWTPCATWDNAVLLCEVERDGDVFPLTAKMQRIAPGEMNTWYLSVKGAKMSARFSTKNPKLLETLHYERGKAQTWRREDLGYDSVYKAITAGIFEFGFTDAILQMICAFCQQVAKGNATILPFGCASLEESRQTHRIFTAALDAYANKKIVAIQ